MSSLKIPHDAIVFVGDGSKALFLRNEGDEKFLHLKTERVFVDDNPPTREQGSDKPGRAFASVGPARSAVEPTNWHQIEQQRFARTVADSLRKLVVERKVKAVVITAPPKTLADLRQLLHDEVKSRVIAEIDKDFTHEPIDQIERRLSEKHSAA
jgi:protein required for attachment to host cells